MKESCGIKHRVTRWRLALKLIRSRRKVSPHRCTWYTPRAFSDNLTLVYTLPLFFFLKDMAETSNRTWVETRPVIWSTCYCRCARYVVSLDFLSLNVSKQVWISEYLPHSSSIFLDYGDRSRDDCDAIPWRHCCHGDELYQAQLFKRSELTPWQK
jgi:hypothetical protein